MTAESKNDFGWDAVDPFDEKDSHFWFKLEHLGRYLFAADYLRQFQPRGVADIACGTGYGLTELIQIADTVVGVDNDQRLLDAVRKRFVGLDISLVNLDLDNGDLTAALGESSLDAVVCFETLEHLVHPSGAISHFSRVLRPSGVLICSVPNALYEGTDRSGLPANKYHKQFFTHNSLSRLLNRNGFTIRYRIGQAWAQVLSKRESRLVSKKMLKNRIGDVPCVNSPEMIRLFAYLLGYPSVEDVEGSYSIIVVAHKSETSG